MISLEQAQQLIGMPALAPLAGKITITQIRQLNDGRILAYNKHNWCCNVEILRDVNRKKFVFDEVEKIEGDSK